MPLSTEDFAMVLGGVRATQTRAPLLLSVEAIIGAGKSTLLEHLDSRSDIVVVREPVELWQQQRGTESLLSRYYGDQKSNGFMFETYAMMSRVKALRDARKLVSAETRAIVMERSWISSRRCFGENSQELGHLDELQASLYEDLFQWGLEAWPKLDGVVYIDLAVPIAQGRVASRGRTAESGIPSDYQMALASKHRQWLYGDGCNAFGGPVLSLDGNMDKTDGALDVMMASVTEFIDQLYTAKHIPPNKLRKQLVVEAGPTSVHPEGYPLVSQTADGNDHEKENLSPLDSHARQHQGNKQTCAGGEPQLFESMMTDEFDTPVKLRKPEAAATY